MSNTQNTDYYESELNEATQGLNDPAVNQLISDMVIFAKAKEEENDVIPPAQGLDPRVRPTGDEPAQFRIAIDQLGNTISEEVLTLFNSFLAYIETLVDSED